MNARKYRTERLDIITGEPRPFTAEELLRERLNRQTWWALTGLFIIITVMVGVTAVLVVLYRGGVI